MRAAASPLRRPGLTRGPQPSRSGTELPWQAACGFAAAFLAGYLPGIWLGRSGICSLGADLAAWYMEKQNYAEFGLALAGLLAGAVIQLTYTLLCGFSAAGIPMLTLFFALRGGFLGLCAASVFASGGARSLVIYWLMSCLPDLAVLLVELWLSVYAASLAGGLFREVFGSGAPRGMLAGGVRRLAVRYSAALLLTVLLCVLGTGLDLLLAGVLL